MTKGKVYLLGLDVISSAGTEVIKEFTDATGAVNTIHVDINEARKHFSEDPGVREFIRKSQQGEYKGNGRYKIISGGNTLIVNLNEPEKIEEAIGITDDPFVQESLSSKGVKRVERPRFLIRDPEVLKKGLMRTEIDCNTENLEERINVDKASEIISGFNDINFINQFWLVQTADGTQGLYQIKQDWHLNSYSDLIIEGEPYLQRLEKQVNFFPENPEKLEKARLSMTLFDITTNHLHQYLALKYLLLDPKIEFVILSGDAGTGKTLMPYLAGLEQTLIRSQEKNLSNNSQVQNLRKKTGEGIYDDIRLLKPSIPPSEYYTGFKPGTTDEKLLGLMSSFRHIHDHEVGLPADMSYETCLKRQEPNKFRTSGIYVPTNSKPLISQEAIEDLKGMTYRDSFIICDEVEDASRRIAKAMMTRQGKGSKLIFCGDTKQIDNPRVRPDTCGLVYAAHGFIKLGVPFFGMIHFDRSDRGLAARYANRLPDFRD